MKEITASSPTRSTKLKKCRKNFDTPSPKISPEEALALVVNKRFSTQQYTAIREQLKSKGLDVYPPSYLVANAKGTCYPSQESITVTDTSAEISLQPLLDLTIRRICTVQAEVLQQLPTLTNLRLISKWGCDGSSAQSRYKQKINEDSTANTSDENLFSITSVPLRLLDNTTSKIIWQNPRPNSTRFCRILKFGYQKETKELIIAKTTQMKEHISNLVPTKIEINNVEVKCQHEMLLTMVDGKICSALSEYSSSQKCYICGASPKDMNNFIAENKTPNPEMYTFGISPLHCWIRAFE